VRSEPPPSLRFQRYQFAHLAGRWRKRSHRSELRVEPPKTEEDCHRLLPELARRMFRPNGAVGIEDLVQIGEIALMEGLRRMRRRGIHMEPPAWRSLMEEAQSQMFHAIDEQVVGWESCTDTEDRVIETLPGASCNVTVARSGSGWELAPGVAESWGAPLPPGSCQPWPTPMCESPRHLPFAVTGNEERRQTERPAAEVVPEEFYLAGVR
jgi:hypothetical protein